MVTFDAGFGGLLVINYYTSFMKTLKSLLLIGYAHMVSEQQVLRNMIRNHLKHQESI